MVTGSGAVRGRGGRSHVVIVGLETTTVRVAEELIRRAVPVVVVCRPGGDQDLETELVRLQGAEVLVVRRVDEEALRHAAVDRARAVVVLGRDEAEAIRVALAVEEVGRGVLLVMEVVNSAFGKRLGLLLEDCHPVCPAEEAVPTFLAAARGDTAPREIAGRVVVVSPDDLLRHPRERLVEVVPPGIQEATQGGHGGAAGVTPAPPRDTPVVMGLRRSWRQVRTRGLVGGWRALLDRRQRGVLALLLAVIVASAVYFHHDAGKDWLTAAYLAVTMATGTGYGDPDDADLRVKVTAVVFQSLGLLLASGLTAVMTDALTGSRLEEIAGGVRGRPRRHVVVCGLGRIGTEVVVGLHDEGVPVVAVERNDDAYGIRRARRMKVPVVIGQASDPSTLRAAGIETCDTVLALTDDDAVNLEIALIARALREDARLVARLYDDDLARRVQPKLGLGACLSVSMLSAPRFVAAALRLAPGKVTAPDRPRQGAVLEVLHVQEGSEAVGRAPAELTVGGEVRVLAVRREHPRHPSGRALLATLRRGTRLLRGLPVGRPQDPWDWRPSQEPLEPGDAIAVAATKLGHDRLAGVCGSTP